ncbi:MAG: DNA mismatch repair endonuclease MutL [Clostridia bacterium]|nr:DNA mismatch repair endonuclease MutL [Clostridia bacterium]
MACIHVLKPHIANQIAAGEVVERPSSVVKELVENSIDAGATAIDVEIESGGMHMIRVTDNGSGIAKDDCRSAFLRHATSKISTADDLERLSTLGFRGEALASIASVSHVTMTTRVKDAETGTRLVYDNGAIVSEEDVACVFGTTFTVEALFSAVPARLKFLKSPRTEAGYIGDYMARMILARPDISFRYRSDGKTVYETYGDGDLFNALYCVYGKTIAEKVVPVAYDDGYCRIDGFIGLPEISRSNRVYQTLLLNGRYIRSFPASASVLQAYDTRLMIGRFPFFVLALTVSPSEFDVNVHPTKLEVRFADEQRICGALKYACKQALSGSAQHVESALEACIPKDVKEQEREERVPERPAVSQFSGLHLNPSAKTSFAMRETPSMNSFRQIGMSGSVPVYRVDSSRSDQPVDRYSDNESLLSDCPIDVIGCAFNGYWIVQRDENLYFVDQHAAHERKLFEQLSNREISIASQPLLIPFEIRLTPSESDLLQRNLDELISLGFRFENVSSLNVSVQAVPVLNGIQLRDGFLHEVLSILAENGGNVADQLVRERLMQSSCKHAIKAGEPITKQEIEALLTEYLSGEAPLTCPHGRPVLIRITKTELEKMFRRIV